MSISGFRPLISIRKSKASAAGEICKMLPGKITAGLSELDLMSLKNLFEFVRNNKTPADEESVDAGAGCLPHKIRKPLRIDFIRIDEEQIAASVLLFDL